MAVLESADAAPLRCSPQRPCLIELKTGEVALGQPIRGCVRRAQLAILEIRDAAVPESKLKSDFLTISCDHRSIFVAPQR